LQAYKPCPKITAETPVTEEMLVEMIEKVKVTNAIQVFENLNRKGEGKFSSLSM